MLNYKRYRKNPVIDYPEREWPGKEIEKAPVWCSVDLRDGNQVNNTAIIHAWIRQKPLCTISCSSQS